MENYFDIIRKGDNEVDLGNFQKAIEIYSQVIQNNKDDYYLYTQEQEFLL